MNLRTATVALVYSAAKYCAPAWCRGSHTRLIDLISNNALRIATGCQRPTTTEHLSELAGIPPAELRHREAILPFACRAIKPTHLLYLKITAPEQEKSYRSLKLRHPFVSAAKGFLTDLAHLKIKAANSAEYSWNLEWGNNNTRLDNLIPNDGNLSLEIHFPRRA